MVEIFREDFETGTTTMTILQDRGEVVVSSENPIIGDYSARCRSFFDSSAGWKWTFGTLSRTISPNIPEVIHEASIRLGQYNSVGIRVLFIGGVRGQLFIFGVQHEGRQAYLYVFGVGFVDLPRYLNIGEVYHVKVRLRCSSASGVTDGAVTVWLNNEVIYENNAIDNSEYGLVANVQVGCQSSWSETSTVDYAEVLVDDIIADDTLPSPTYYALSVGSSPVTGVRFSLNGIEKITPYSEALVEGSYPIMMPSEVTVGTDTYRFLRWNDGNTNGTRTVLLNMVTSLVAEYDYIPPPTTHQLTVNSTPIQGVPFTIEKVT